MGYNVNYQAVPASRYSSRPVYYVTPGTTLPWGWWIFPNPYL